MTLSEFRELTAHLPGDLEFVCAGGSIAVVWHDEEAISIDDGEDYEVASDATVLFREPVWQTYDRD